MAGMDEELYLSPHLDDALYACGGWITRQTAMGVRVTVLTVCAGDPPEGPLSDFARSLHARWGEGGPPMRARRAEDRGACKAVGAQVRHLQLPEAAYRTGLGGEPHYPTEKAIFGKLLGQERILVSEVADRIQAAAEGFSLYCPAGFGGHVDHRLTRAAAERLGIPLRYYADFPYSARGLSIPPELGPPPGRKVYQRLTAEELDAWVRAITAYRTQFFTFWKDVESLRWELRRYHDGQGGLPFWLPGRTSSRREA
jgi:LmbE family N-acetylglucosaminyl deacetylase